MRAGSEQPYSGKFSIAPRAQDEQKDSSTAVQCMRASRTNVKRILRHSIACAENLLLARDIRQSITAAVKERTPARFRRYWKYSILTPAFR
jgi:hypothetical protein